MNYRHAFHAGNFADVLKHAVLLAVLRRLVAGPGPLQVLDTHAGAGAYNLAGSDAQRSREAEAGIGRLLAAKDPPAVFAPLLAAVRRLNGGGAGSLYPGSPLLTVQALQPGDRYVGCELQPEAAQSLRRVLHEGAPKGVGAELREADGFAAAGERAAGRRFLLIDPPFERGDDYARIAEGLAANRRNPVMVWLPLKDLDTFDRFLSAAEDAGAGDAQVVELRLRLLDQPLKMNGCALLLVRCPDIEAEGMAAAAWLADACGGEGALGRVWRLG